MLRKNDIPAIAELFASDPEREQDFRASQSGWELDFSRIPIKRERLEALYALTESSNLAAAVTRLFAGEAVNSSERQPALHMALRAGEASGFDPASTWHRWFASASSSWASLRGCMTAAAG
jgi:glucose-6-phosphate isomerase